MLNNEAVLKLTLALERSQGGRSFTVEDNTVRTILIGTLVGFILFLGLSAHASVNPSPIGPEVILSKTIAFPVSSLEKVEQAMADAAARTGADKKTWKTYDIDTNLQVVCAEDSPVMYRGHLYGCVLQTSVDLGAGATALLRNMLYIQQSSSDVNALLAQTDANQTARLDLQTPFDGGHGSTYYCNAEGSSGSRTWGCFLNFVDASN